MDDKLELSAAQVKFVQEWRKMHAFWGVEEECAHAQAVLFLLQEAVPMQALAEHMGISGQKLRAVLKPLLDLEMVKQVEVEGDRRQYVVCDLDFWEMIRRLFKIRIENEVFEPVKIVRECAKLSRAKGDAREHKQFKEMLEVYELAELAYKHLDKLSTQRIRQLVHMATAALQVIDSRNSWWPGSR